MPNVKWDIRREGRKLTGDEALERYDVFPEKTEFVDGKFFWREEERLSVLAVMLENVGIDKAIRLGDAQLWRAAIADLDD